MKKRAGKSVGSAKARSTTGLAYHRSSPGVAVPAVIDAAFRHLAATGQFGAVPHPTGGQSPKTPRAVSAKPQIRMVKVGSYAMFVDTSALERINIVRAGVPSRVVPRLASDLGVEQGYLVDRLGLARSTVARKVRANGLLSAHESERTLGLAQVVGLVEAMTTESGAPEGFDPAGWVGDWISRPQPALGGRPPADLLDTAEGLQLVMQLLQQSQSSAYA